MIDKIILSVDFMNIRRELLVTILIGVFSVTTFWFSINLLHIFLIWNMMLAIIPIYI